MVELYVLGREAVMPEEQRLGVVDRGVYLRANTLTEDLAALTFSVTNWEQLFTNFSRGSSRSEELARAPLMQQIERAISNVRESDVGVIITPAPVKQSEFWHYRHDVDVLTMAGSPSHGELPSQKPGLIYAGKDITDNPYAWESRDQTEQLGLDGSGIPLLLRDGAHLGEVVDGKQLGGLGGQQEGSFWMRRAWYFQSRPTPKHSKIKAFFASLR